MDNIIVLCPHCDIYIFIEKLNCCIFRHAVLISTKNQINPHTSKEDCDNLISQNLILGCGKPFKIIKYGEKITAEICEYIDRYFNRSKSV